MTHHHMVIKTPESAALVRAAKDLLLTVHAPVRHTVNADGQARITEADVVRYALRFLVSELVTKGQVHIDPQVIERITAAYGGNDDGTN